MILHNMTRVTAAWKFCLCEVYLVLACVVEEEWSQTTP